jgi:hypothetical protein
MAATTTSSDSSKTGGFERAAVGALGGLCAVIVKYLSQDNQTLIDFVRAYSADAAPFSGFVPYIVDYAIITPILLFLGAVVGWISGESVRLKLFAIGVSAPALITTWSSGTASTHTASIEDAVISQAYAGPQPPTGFALEVDALADPAAAQRRADDINRRAGSFQAFVMRVPGSGPPFKVRVLGYMNFGDALKLRQALLGVGVGAVNVIDMSKQPPSF